MTCAGCGAVLVAGALFCENCGAKVGAAGATAPTSLDVPATATDQDSPISTPTVVSSREVETKAPQTSMCAECGGRIGAEGYCELCGTKAVTERDHFRELPAPWVAGVCDRGIVHHRNEDAMALWADAVAAPTASAAGRAVLVVCDGVSSSQDSDVAALAAARAARDVLRAPMPKGLGVPDSVEAAASKVFAAAAAAANTAVIANTQPSSPNPASCTFVAATVESTAPGAWLVRHACIGDSRAYWLPDAGPGVQLTIDDSMAQMLIVGGATRAEAEASRQAHAITKWLGRDSPDIMPTVGAVTLDRPGWLLVCSDGLWNYASEPDALAAQVVLAAQARVAPDTAAPSATGSPGVVSPADPEALALAMVDFAKRAGGQDNITVAVARLDLPPGDAAGSTDEEREGHG